jgi:hypothetical protein
MQIAALGAAGDRSRRSTTSWRGACSAFGAGRDRARAYLLAIVSAFGFSWRCCRGIHGRFPVPRMPPLISAEPAAGPLFGVAAISLWQGWHVLEEPAVRQPRRDAAATPMWIRRATSPVRGLRGRDGACAVHAAILFLKHQPDDLYGPLSVEGQIAVETQGRCPVWTSRYDQHHRRHDRLCRHGRAAVPWTACRDRAVPHRRAGDPDLFRRLAAPFMARSCGRDGGLHPLSIPYILLGEILVRSAPPTRCTARSRSGSAAARRCTNVRLRAFSAVPATSVSTAATIATVALPSFRRRRYDDVWCSARSRPAPRQSDPRRASPSSSMRLYWPSVGQLYAAAIIPSVMMTVLFMLTIVGAALLRPDLTGEEGAARMARGIRALPTLRPAGRVRHHHGLGLHRLGDGDRSPRCR